MHVRHLLNEGLLLMSENSALRPAVLILVLLVSGALLVFAGWVVLGSWAPKTTFGLSCLIAFFIFAPIGSLWMLYDCAVREKPPVLYYLMALFLPYAFVWYYFDRVRPRQIR